MASEPDLRILQANERTLLAWVRTGLTMMALGFVLARLSVWLHFEHPERETFITSWLGIAIVLLGTVCQLLGALRFFHARRAIIAGDAIIPSGRGPIAIAAAVGLLGLVAIVFLAATA